MTIQNNIGEDHIRHSTFITILDTQTTVTALNHTIVYHHMIDRIHILAAYLDRTTAAFHHAIGHYDVMTRTILLKLTSVFQTNGIITTRNMTVGYTHILAMIDVNTITIAYFQIIQKIDTINQSAVTTYQMHSPVGTFTNRNITDRQILHTYQREDMRTRIKSSYRFQFITVKQLCSHKLNTIAMNRTVS